jgi:hypothetical protein
MYAASAFQETDSDISGLFAVNPDGSVSRFCNDLVRAGFVGVDGVGTFFDGNMFVIGTDSFGGANALWRVYADGSAEKFMTGVDSFTFGADGAMYVSAYNSTADQVTIARVVPEPATLLLIISGVFCLRKKKI